MRGSVQAELGGFVAAALVFLTAQALFFFFQPFDRFFLYEVEDAAQQFLGDADILWQGLKSCSSPSIACTRKATIVPPLSVFSWAIWAISELMAPVGTASIAAFAPSGGLRVQAVDEGLGLHAGELFEESCGFELVAGLEVFQFTFDGGDEEFDYEAAAVGFFERHLSERLDEFAAGGVLCLLLCICNHTFCIISTDVPIVKGDGG